MLESTYQAALILRIKDLLPGCIIQKNDTAYMQGYPDLTIYHGNKWALLEVKASEKAPYQPNQEYYLELYGQLTYTATIYPSNEREILRGLQQALQPCRHPRHFKS